MNCLDVCACNFNQNYLVYSDGSLYNGKEETFRKIQSNGALSPYLFYSIPNPLLPTGVKGKHKKFYIHRLVAEHFIPNPDNLSDVHHKDSDPSNNDISNLEWLSHQQNCALKQVPDPIDFIKKNPSAYIYWDKSANQYKFYYRGHSHLNIPPVTKYFHSKEDAIEFRQKVLSHRLVA
tara:strand:+ start:2869 stop:3399 length:531 start_codon:yes stop_codon:yes gene_type:complete